MSILQYLRFYLKSYLKPFKKGLAKKFDRFGTFAQLITLWIFCALYVKKFSFSVKHTQSDHYVTVPGYYT